MRGRNKAKRIKGKILRKRYLRDGKSKRTLTYIISGDCNRNKCTYREEKNKRKYKIKKEKRVWKIERKKGEKINDKIKRCMK